MNQSQHKALETWYKPEDRIDVEVQLNQAFLQLASEAGELAGEWAKNLYKPGRKMTWETVIDELGDVWYYVRIIACLYGISIDELTQYNYDKLRGGHGWAGSAEKINDE
jgi:NTP pyrophosphatase (non-canonical NTP hydrolase)